MQASETSGHDQLPAGGHYEGATWGRILVAVALFVYLFVFVWRYVDTQLLYHGDMVVLGPEWRISFPWFQTGWQHFIAKASQLGGVADYFGDWLAQYFYYPLAGALVYTLLGLGMYVGTILLGRALRTSGRWGVAYLSPLVVLAIASIYALRLGALVGVMFSLYAVFLYALVTMARPGVVIRLAAFSIFCLAIFWIAEGSCLVFAVGCGLIEWRQGKHGWLLLSYVAIGILVTVAGQYVYLMNRSDEGFLFTWQRLYQRTYRSWIPAGIYLGQIAAMLLWTWFSGYRERRAQRKAVGGRPVHERWFFDTVGVAVLAGAALLASFGVLDVESRSLLQANYLARMGKWSEMLEEVTLHPPAAYPPCLLYDINRALYETGQLADRMFAYPQNPEYLIQFGKSAVPHRGCQELLLALGCVNEAEQTACEALEVRGPLPYILRQLVLINVVKDRPEAARVFLNLLCRDVIHRPWALETLRRLDEDPRLDSDEEVTQLRRVMLKEERISLGGNDLFDLALEQDPKNRMAFEYRMAYWLLTCQLDKIGEQIPAMRELGYRGIPKSYAEALLMNWQINGKQPELGDWRIDGATMDRFKSFVELTRNRSRDPAALAQLASGTYYEYFFAYNAMSP